MVQMDFKTRLNQIWDKLFREGISYSVTAIEQLSHLFFLKWLEVTDNVSSSIFTRPNQEPGTGAEEFALRWSYITGMYDSEKLRYVAGTVFPWLKEKGNTRHEYSNLMATSVFLISKPSLLTEAMEVIDSAFPGDEVTPTDNDYWSQVGESYEYLLEKMGTLAKSSQVRLPPELTMLMCGMAAPNSNDTICDPACGSADLLIAARSYILNHAPAALPNFGAILHGFDYDPAMARMAMMNLMLHGIPQPDVTVKPLLADAADLNQYSLLLGNPVVTTTADSQMNTSLPGAEHIVRLAQMLMLHGRAVIMVPHKMLADTGPAFVTMRQSLFLHAAVEAVVFFPQGFFRQYNTAMALVYFVKNKVAKPGKSVASGMYINNNVWFYQAMDGDLQTVLPAYEHRDMRVSEARTTSQFTVAFDEIEKNNFSLDMNLYRTLEPMQQKPEKKEIIEKDNGIKGVFSTMKDVLKDMGRQEVEEMMKKITKPYIQLLPEAHKHLWPLLHQLSLDDLDVLDGDPKDTVERLVALLKKKEQEDKEAAADIANRHPYHLELLNACDCVPGGQPVNWLLLVQEHGLQGFTAKDILACLAPPAPGTPLYTEDMVEEQLAMALGRFFLQVPDAFTFFTLQKVLKQLQFLPAFTLLSKIITDSITAETPTLCQLYYRKEYVAAAEAVNNEFQLFVAQPGHLHILHKDHLQKFQPQFA